MGIKRIEDLITYKPGRDDKAELITDTIPENIVYDDELEDERIRGNYSALIKVLLSLLKRRNCIDLRTFNECAARIFGEELFENGDYYSFIVHLCQKRSTASRRTDRSRRHFLMKSSMTVPRPRNTLPVSEPTSP